MHIYSLISPDFQCLHILSGSDIPTEGRKKENIHFDTSVSNNMRVALISIFEQFYTRTRTRTIYVCSAERLKLLCFFGRAFAEPYMKPLTRRVIFLSLFAVMKAKMAYTQHIDLWLYLPCFSHFEYVNAIVAVGVGSFFLRWLSASFHISCKKIIKSNKKIHLKCLLSNWWVSFDECTFACSYSTCCTYIRVRAYERGWERVPD